MAYCRCYSPFRGLDKQIFSSIFDDPQRAAFSKRRSLVPTGIQRGNVHIYEWKPMDRWFSSPWNSSNLDDSRLVPFSMEEWFWVLNAARSTTPLECSPEISREVVAVPREFDRIRERDIETNRRKLEEISLLNKFRVCFQHLIIEYFLKKGSSFKYIRD